MKRLVAFVALLTFAGSLHAQLSALSRIEPSSWWTGMKDRSLQLLVYGKDIGQREVSLAYPGVKLLKVNRVENPNYLFLDLEIGSTAKPGTFSLNFTQKGKTSVSRKFTINARAKQIGRNLGVTDRDLIYLIMPDRFANGDPSNDVVPGMKETTLNRDSMYYRHGGDIQGIMDRLGYLKQLGVTTIWCTPEIENDMREASYHGYAATDFYRIDPRYGTNELYKKYVEACHAQGLKVIKDIVHNHCGLDHWFIRDLPMKNWVHQWDTYIQTTYKDQTVMDPYAAPSDRKRMLDGWFVPSMPDLDQSNPYVQNYLIQNHLWWIEYAGIDGLRLDTYPYNDPPFMARWAKRVRLEFPNVSIFGETLVNAVINQAFFTQGRTISQKLDTALPGITDTQVKDAIYETLNGKFGWTSGVNRLYSVLANDFVYEDARRNVIFMDNHDMSRYLSIINEDFGKYKAGLSILLTTRGIPQVYYGTEILMKNFSNPDGLVRFDFKGGWPGDKDNKFTPEGRSKRENEAWDFFSKLANFRKTSPALQKGKLMQYVPENGIYVYFRYTDGQTVMVIVNTNDSKQDLQNRFKERITDFGNARNIMTGELLNDISTLHLPPSSVTILEVRGAKDESLPRKNSKQ